MSDFLLIVGPTIELNDKYLKNWTNTVELWSADTHLVVEKIFPLTLSM